MTKFESSIKEIPHNQELVYAKLSDLNHLEKIKDRLPQDKVRNMSFDTDTLTLEVSPVGQLVLKIVDREPCKLVKLETVQSPLPFNLWIQLVPLTEHSCKIKVTVGMEINPFMKTMVEKPLTNALEKMVEMFSLINYSAE